MITVRTWKPLFLTLTLVHVLCPYTALAQGVASEEAETSHAAAQLFEGMGPYRRAFTTDSEEALLYLNQGMTWIQAFNHQEAIRSFLKAAELDPDCAWAWWGVAYCEGPNYNDPQPDETRCRAAWYAIQNALARMDQSTPLEQSLITALTARYSPHWPQDREKLNEGYSDAMQEVWRAHSNNPDVGCLYAESMMQLTPWKLYSIPEREPKERTHEIREVLEQVMALDPSHPGAKHLYIHTVEPSRRPDDALQAARDLNDLVPASGHLLHMPSHIYIQTGHWQDAIEQNIKAVASDRRYRELTTVQSIIQYGYQSHNLHMLAFAAMMVGQERTAMKYAREMWALIPPEEMEAKGPGIDFSLMCVYDVQKRFGRWDALLEEPAPPAYLLLTTAYWRSHRAIAYAAKKMFQEAETEYVEFLKAKNRLPQDSIEEGTFSHRILKVSEHFIQGEIALQKEDWDTASWHLERAAQIEDTLLYTEPPYWLQPVRHTLGAVYMKAGLFEQAERAYRRDLQNWRDNGWSLYGLNQALEAQGKDDLANEARLAFQRVWKNADEPLLTTSCKCIEQLHE